MSLPTDPTTQLSRLVELNTDIAAARGQLSKANADALHAARAAGAAQENLAALEASRDELLEAMKHYTTPAAAPAGSTA